MNQTIRNLLLLCPRDGIRWLLRDEFTDTRATGAVNGTPATPGPGARTVVDTGNNLSIGSGYATSAGHAASHDPSIHYADVPTVRQAGRMLLGRMYCGAMCQVNLGWDGGTSGFPDEHAWRFLAAGGGTKTYLGITPVSGPVITVQLWYSVAIILRATGAYYLIKGQAFTTWTLAWVTATQNNTPLYAAYTSSADSGERIDSFRIPNETWLPVPLAYDTFTRGNGAIGVSEILGPDGQAVTARTYTAEVGVWAVSGNTCVATTLGIVTLPALHADVVLQATLTTPAAGVTPGGIVVRWLDANNYWYVRVTPGTAGNDFELVEINAGVPTVRAAADIDPAPATAYTITVITYGQTIDVYWGNTRSIQYTTAALNETQGIHGLRDEGNTNFAFDNLLVFPRGMNDEYVALEKWA